MRGDSDKWNLLETREKLVRLEKEDLLSLKLDSNVSLENHKSKAT